MLSFGIAKSGCRTYLGISGGIKTEKVLGSRSQYKNITSSDKISKNTIIPIGKSNFKPAVGTRVKEQKINYANKKIEVYKGPEFKYLGKDQQNLIEKKIFQISSLNNRMAYQLKEKFTHSLPQIWTSPVIPWNSSMHTRRKYDNFNARFTNYGWLSKTTSTYRKLNSIDFSKNNKQ